MKKTTLALSFATMITLSSSAQALELIVINNYKDAAAPEIWQKVKTDQVPDILLSQESLKAPGAAYSSLFPKSFLQEELFTVCHKSCNEKEIFKVRNGEIDTNDRTRWDVVEQSNVYFWLNKYFNFLDQKLNYRPDQYLKVTTNRELRDETKGKKLKNNAFFNPRDISLSFLPATKNLLFKLVGGKINRSGFDPSVVAHEASHYLFHHLFPNAVNDEIGGLNEGFADYIANIFLNNSKVGLVMLHGKALRDSAEQVDSSGKFKTYEPGMEVHNLGERVAYALWKTRELADDKNEFDRMVIDSVQALNQNPYSSVHDFKMNMLERLSHVVSSHNISFASSIWDLTFPGKPNRLENTEFLSRPTNGKAMLGFKTKQQLPEILAKEYGTPAVEESNFSIIQMETISESQVAILMSTTDGNSTTPYWIVVDVARNNILAIYNENKELVTEEKELEKAKTIAEKGKGVVSFIQDFTSKAGAFAELSQGKGDFNAAYKVKSKTVTLETIIFNGTPVTGQKLHMELKRRFLAGLLLGLPEISSIDLYTVPSEDLSTPEINGQKVIGYKLLLKTGTATEVIMTQSN